MSKKHALVIGGSGMLAGVSRFLAKEGFAVSVVGRNYAKLQLLKNGCPPESIFPIQADYNTDLLFTKVKEAINARGPFQIIVNWMPNTNALEQVCQLNKEANSFRLVHVKGSRRYFEDEEIQVSTNCLYEEVYLGFILEGDTARWLTHDEISGGVIEQIKHEGKLRIVGQLQPYSARPM